MPRAPLLSMFIAVFFGTLLVHLTMIAAAWLVMGGEFSFWDALNLVALPSVLLNLALAGWLDGALAPVLVQLPRVVYRQVREAWGLPEV